MRVSEKAVFQVILALTATLAFWISGCSSAAKRTTPELSALEGKRVAITAIAAEPTTKTMIEAAIVNQLRKRGSFILVPQLDVEKARTLHHLDPRDDRKIAEAVDASHTLRIEVLKFEATETKGFGSQTIVDSQLAEERGGDGKTERTFPVKVLDGAVRYDVIFLDTLTGDTRRGIAEATHKIEAEASREAIHLPPKLRFLEDLTNEAFQEFFDRYN